MSMLEMEDMLSGLQNLVVFVSGVGVGVWHAQDEGAKPGRMQNVLSAGRVALAAADRTLDCARAAALHCRDFMVPLQVYFANTVGVYTPRMPHIMRLVLKQERASVPLTLAALATHLASASAGLNLVNWSGVTLSCWDMRGSLHGLRARQKPPSQEPTERPLGMVQLVLLRADLASGRHALPC